VFALVALLLDVQRSVPNASSSAGTVFAAGRDRRRCYGGWVASGPFTRLGCWLPLVARCPRAASSADRGFLVTPAPQGFACWARFHGWALWTSPHLISSASLRGLIISSNQEFLGGVGFRRFCLAKYALFFSSSPAPWMGGWESGWNPPERTVAFAMASRSVRVRCGGLCHVCAVRGGNPVFGNFRDRPTGPETVSRPHLAARASDARRCARHYGAESVSHRRPAASGHGNSRAALPDDGLSWDRSCEPVLSSSEDVVFLRASAGVRVAVSLLALLAIRARRQNWPGQPPRVIGTLLFAGRAGGCAAVPYRPSCQSLPVRGQNLLRASRTVPTALLAVVYFARWPASPMGGQSGATEICRPASHRRASVTSHPTFVGAGCPPFGPLFAWDFLVRVNCFRDASAENGSQRRVAARGVPWPRTIALFRRHSGRPARRACPATC